jgi:hypothetical protein
MNRNLVKNCLLATLLGVGTAMTINIAMAQQSWPATADTVLQQSIESGGYDQVEMRNIRTLLEILATPTGLEDTSNQRYFCGSFKSVGQPPFRVLSRLYGKSDGFKLSSLKNLKREVKDVLAKGDRVYAQVYTTSIQAGPLFGVPASGKQIELHERSFFRFTADGKLCEDRRQIHEADLYKQLGGVMTFPIDQKQMSSARP